ncbi:N-acetyltransferase [Citricoccus sp. SGAir0253]|uniref:GNAT family N-acetyltransferase n=1 Tax=Citricoccus sp. SGAir0253 TaxID=2567881 RepID=UPI0010CCB1EE|nr:GNAT family N-acetyltransferase [Citricoccus sp. SGAir0253]QCU78573.1 N-acetyltransferase [Citricoccus sp. SGAir0253]
MTAPDAGRQLPPGLALRPWAEGDDLRLLEVWGDPADPQQHQDRAMLRPSSAGPAAGREAGPWARCLVAEDEGVPVAAAVVYASSVHPQRLWCYAETARGLRRRGIATALLEALRAEVRSAREAGEIGTAELKARFAVVPGAGDDAGDGGDDGPGEGTAGTEAFLAGQGFAPLQRSRRVAVGPGVITPPELDGTGVTVEDLATGSVELTQAVAAFYEATHGWDPAVMTVGRAQQLLLGPATGASGAVVLRPRPKAEGGLVHAFAISYTPERTDDPTDVLLGWNPELAPADAQFAVGALLSLLTTQYPVQVEVDEAMDALAPILDQLVATGHARVLLDTRIWATDAAR